MVDHRKIPFSKCNVSVSHNGVFDSNLKLLSVSFSNRTQFRMFETVMVACSSSFSFGCGFLAGFMLSKSCKSDRNSSL